jgi:hypothetical protein
MLVLFVVILTMLICLNYQKVNLIYLDKFEIFPPIEVYRKEPFWLTRTGKDIKKYIDDNLFPEIYLSKSGALLNSKPYPKIPEYKINWSNSFVFDEDTIYYAGIGCEIKEISYFYHTKFFYRGDCFKTHKTILTPFKHMEYITIYKAIVSVGGF